MSVDLIRYDLLVQDALRAVVRRVLTDVARDGLPGDHHLYISFDTRAPGVRLSPRLKEKYPEEMTIVLQHQFWDLIVTETFFEVGLSFNGIPERLHVPFDTLKGFFDPSVKFGLQFEPTTVDELEAEDDDVPVIAPAPVATGPRVVPDNSTVTSLNEARPTSVPSTKAPAKPAAKAEPEPKVEAKQKVEPKAEAKPQPKVEAKPEPKPAKATEAAKPTEQDDAAKADAQKGGAQVVRLDAFRKK